MLSTGAIPSFEEKAMPVLHGKVVLACVVLGSLAGCKTESMLGPRTPLFHLTTDGIVYAPGGTASGSLHNDGSTAIPYSFCSGNIERRSRGGRWDSVSTFAQPCAAVALFLAPGDSVRWRLPLDGALTEGTYRVRYPGVAGNVSTADSVALRSTPPFGVVANAALSGIPDSVATAYWFDARLLAVRELQRTGTPQQQSIEASGAVVASFYAALTAVHEARNIAAVDTVVNRYRIHAPGAGTQLLVGVDPSASWVRSWQQGSRLTGNSAVDALMERYSLTLTRYYGFGTTPFVALLSPLPLNMPALATRFGGIAGIRYAEPNALVGGDRDITASAANGGWSIEYSLGWGDCPAGCISRHYWTFAVTGAGAVNFLGSRGNPAP